MKLVSVVRNMLELKQLRTTFDHCNFLKQWATQAPSIHEKKISIYKSNLSTYLSIYLGMGSTVSRREWPWGRRATSSPSSPSSTSRRRTSADISKLNKIIFCSVFGIFGIEAYSSTIALHYLLYTCLQDALSSHSKLIPGMQACFIISFCKKFRTNLICIQFPLSIFL